MSRLKHYISRLSQERKPVRFLLSRFLQRTRLGTFLYIYRDGYVLRFYPTALSATLWLNPQERLQDESFLRMYLKAGDTYLDVGANIGTLVLTASNSVGPSGKVYAFEAHPVTARYLRKNLALNNVSNVVVYNLALSDKEGSVGFSSFQSDDQNCVSDADNALMVKALPLDDVCSSISTIALLKIDVEGYEKVVLEGGRRTLESVSVVYLEVNEDAFRKFGYGFSDIFDFLVGCGFVLCKLDGETLVTLCRDYRPHVTSNILALRDINQFVERLDNRVRC